MFYVLIEVVEKITLDELAERAGIDLGSIEWLEKTIKKSAMALRQLKMGEDVTVYKNIFAENSNDVQPLYRYLKHLKEGGELDIGKGNCEYGFRMPLQKKTDNKRELILYRK